MKAIRKTNCGTSTWQMLCGTSVLSFKIRSIHISQSLTCMIIS